MDKLLYFIGIGGIGMSALARFYRKFNCKVAGYDRTPSELTEALENEGIHIHYDDKVANIPPEFRSRDTLVVYTPAIPKDSAELNWFLSNGNRVVKRAALIGELSKDLRTLAVAGTHGKTTTSTLLAHLMTVAADGCTAFLGGISKNYDSNMLDSNDSLMVVEADEYDRSFLYLAPYIAVVTAADPDHLDIYGTAMEMKKAFGEFVAQIHPDGALILKDGVDIPLNNVPCRIYSYSYNNPDTDFHACNISLSDGAYHFDIQTPECKIAGCCLTIPGWVNIENAVAAVAAAILGGAQVERIGSALNTFQGVKRRFDVHVNTPECVYIDDYAHHPKELSAAVSSVREMYPSRKLLGVFQPHLYTRTRDFAAEFAESLSLLDELILLDIYPARELPIAGVTSQIIFDGVTIADKQLCSKLEFMSVLRRKTDIDVLITLGAGDIDRFVEPITAMLNSRSHGN
jgi:UDP-N-acetylmuramate--alanine ligase